METFDSIRSWFPLRRKLFLVNKKMSTSGEIIINIFVCVCVPFMQIESEIVKL